MEETNLIDIILSEGDSTSKLKKLSVLEESGFPVMKLLLDNYIDLFKKVSEIGSLLDVGPVKTPSDIEKVINCVKKIKSPIPSSSEMNTVLDELQEKIRKIKNSI